MILKEKGEKEGDKGGGGREVLKLWILKKDLRHLAGYIDENFTN